MNNLSTISELKTMSSIEIASLTGKRHDHILSDIRRILLEVEIDSTQFKGVYKDQQLIDRPCFNLPRRECDLVIAGYSAKYRLAIIDRWQALEATHKIPKSFSEALRLAADTQDKLDAAEEKIIQDAPKVAFAESVRRLDGCCSVSDFAKAIGTGQNRLFKRLRDDGFLMVNNRPYQIHIDRGLFDVIEQTPYVDRDGKSHPAFKTVITGKGQVYLEKRYRVVVGSELASV
jgi:phage antirepressor YoqD-like protein